MKRRVEKKANEIVGAALPALDHTDLCVIDRSCNVPPSPVPLSLGCKYNTLPASLSPCPFTSEREQCICAHSGSPPEARMGFRVI